MIQIILNLQARSGSPLSKETSKWSTLQKSISSSIPDVGVPTLDSETHLGGNYRNLLVPLISVVHFPEVANDGFQARHKPIQSILILSQVGRRQSG